jgi:hypothetical protein
MSPTDQNPSGRKPAPLYLRTFFFGLMLFAWWVLTVEVPGRMLFRIVVQRGVERQYTPLSVWAFSVTQSMMGYRGLAVGLIVVAMAFHYWLWTRLPRYDVYGKWLFRAGFLVFYIVLYTFFFLVFLGAELPVWTWPSEIVPTNTP